MRWFDYDPNADGSPFAWAARRALVVGLIAWNVSCVVLIVVTLVTR